MSQVDIPGLPLNTTPPQDSLFEISNSGVSESTRLQDIIFGLQPESEKDQPNGYAGLDGSGLIDPSQIPDISGTYQVISEKGLPNGYASLDGSGDVPLSQIPDLSGTYQAISEKDIANGYAGLDGSGLLKLSAYPAGNALEFLRRNAANTALEFASTGSVSPLTTKGDVYGFDTGDARIPVGTDGQVLTANSVQALGVEWTTLVTGADTPWTVDHDAAGFKLINVSQFETNATNPAASGTIRLGDTESISFRNGGNDLDYSILSDDEELQFNGWLDISFIEAEDVSFPVAQVVVSTLQLNGTGELDVGGSQIFDVGIVKSSNSTRDDLVLNLGNTEVVSWQKTIPVNGAISITTNASDNFVIQRSASEVGAFVEEYTFNSTGADFLNKNLTMGTAYIDMGEISTPANPAANVGRLYTKDVAAITKLFFLDSAGTETNVLASASPLTTKGDLFTYDTGNQRLPVGIDGQVLQADSVEVTGLKWVTPASASQTPWTQDINAAGFDLLNFGLLQSNGTANVSGAINLDNGEDIVWDSVNDPTINVDSFGGMNIKATGGLFYSNPGIQANFTLDANHGVPAAGQVISRIDSADNNSVLAQSVYTRIESKIFDPTSASEDGELIIYADTAGTLTQYVSFNEGGTSVTKFSTNVSFDGNNISNAVLTTSISVANSINWADGVKQTFNPDNTNAGLNVGANALEPSAPVDGDLFYDSATFELKARINAAWVALGSGGGAANSISQLDTNITVTDTGADGLAVFQVDGNLKMSMDAQVTSMLQTRFALAKATTDSNISGNVVTLNNEGNYFEFNNTVATLDGISTTDWQPGSIINLRFRDANATGVTLAHQSATTPPIEPLFLIGATNFQVTNANDEIIFTFMWDGTNWVELNRSTASSQTPWASDIDAAGFDLQNLSNLEFQITTGAPAGGKDAIWADAQQMNLNVNTGKFFQMSINATKEYTFETTEATWNGNDLTGVKDISLTGNIIFPDGVRQTFNPNATNAGLNVGLQSSPDPTSPVNGDLYYNSTTDKFRAYEGGVWKDVLGGSQSPWLSDIDAADFNLLNVGYVESGSTNPAQSGTIRLANLDGITWRDAANTGNHVLLADSDDNLSTQMSINGIAGDLIFKRINFEHLRLTGFGISVTGEVDLTTFINLTEIATPANPAANEGRLYVKDVSTITQLFFLDSAGTETQLTSVGGSQTPWIQNVDAAEFNLSNAGDISLNKTGSIRTLTFQRDEALADDTAIGSIEFNAHEAGATLAQYARIEGGVTDDVTTDEDGFLKFYVREDDFQDRIFIHINPLGDRNTHFTEPVNMEGNALRGLAELIAVNNTSSRIFFSGTDPATINARGDKFELAKVNTAEAYFSVVNQGGVPQTDVEIGKYAFWAHENDGSSNLEAEFASMIGTVEDTVTVNAEDASLKFQMFTAGSMDLYLTMNDASSATISMLKPLVMNTNNITGLPGTFIGALTTVTAVTGDFVMIQDATDSALKKVNVSDFLGGSAQTPWTSDIQGANFDLLDVTRVQSTYWEQDTGSPVATIGQWRVAALGRLSWRNNANTADVSIQYSSTSGFRFDDNYFQFFDNEGNTYRSQVNHNTIVVNNTPIGEYEFWTPENDGSSFDPERFVFLQAVMISRSIVDTEEGGYRITMMDSGTPDVIYMTFNEASSHQVDILKELDMNSQKISGMAGTTISDLTLVTGASGDFVMISDTSDSGNLKKVDVVDFLSASLTPWTEDIEAATFDLNNLGNLNFSLTGATGLPAITEPYITWDDTLVPDAMRFNVPTGQEYAFYVNGVEEYHWSVSEFNLHNNILQAAGNIFQVTTSAVGLVQLGRSDEVTGQDVSDIRFQAGNTRYAEIITHMVSAVSGSEIGELEFLIKNDNVTTMDSLLRLVGGATATSARVFIGAPMGTTLDMGNFVVNNVSSVRSAATPISTVGFVRMSNAELIGWRNNGNSADHTITFNSSDQFVIQVTSGSDYLFSETEFSAGGNNITNVAMFSFQTSNEQTISTGAITITRSWHSVDTEGNAATDDLDTINGGVNGRVLVIRAEDATHTVVVKDGTGNIQCAGDFSMDNTHDSMTLIYDGTNWLEMSRSDNSP